MDQYKLMKIILEDAGLEHEASELSNSTPEQFFGDKYRYANGYPTSYNQKIFVDDHPYYTEMLFKDGKLISVQAGE